MLGVLAPGNEKTRVAGCWGVKSSLPTVDGAESKARRKRYQEDSVGQPRRAPPSTANGIHQARLIGFDIWNSPWCRLLATPKITQTDNLGLVNLRGDLEWFVVAWEHFFRVSALGSEHRQRYLRQEAVAWVKSAAISHVGNASCGRK